MKPSERVAQLLAAIEPFSRLELQFDPEALPSWRQDDERRRELLSQLRAGELDELTVNIVATTEIERPRPLPFAERSKATANFTRFHLPEFEAFAASFVGQPFLRDHSSRSADAGGRIVTSTAGRRRNTHLIRQELLLVKPWAMEDALDGTMRAFSIGWAPRERGFRGFIESAFCTVCDGPMFGSASECMHWPGDVVKLGETGKRFIVELEWRNVIGKETSEVTFPAASGTGIEGSIRQLSQLAEALRPAGIPGLRPKETDMDPKLLAQLGLAPDATIEDALAALEELKQSSPEPSTDLELERARRLAAEADRDRHAEIAAAARSSRIAELRSGALERGLFREGSSRAGLFDLTVQHGGVVQAEDLLSSWEGDPEVPVAPARADRPIQRIGSHALPRIEDARRATPGGSIEIPTGGDERDKFLNGATAWMIIRAGRDRSVRQAMEIWGDEAKQKLGVGFELDPGEFRGRSCADLARIALERAGEDVSRLDKQTLIGRALTQRSAYNTSGDFPLLLENVMHKMLMAAYAITPDTWRSFCANGRVEDFRPHNRYRMGSFGRLQRVNEHGEFTNQQIPDSRREQIAADTLGNIIGISRKSLVNDDMGAFSRLTTMGGRAAALSIEADVYDELGANAGLGPLMADGLPLFDAAHDNIGVGSALDTDGLDADRIVMASQQDESSNDFLDLKPDVLVVPLSLGGTARVTVGAEFEPSTTVNDRTPNKVRDIVSTIVDTARLSGTRRYMFADPSVAPTLEVAFLDGQEEPFLEIKDGWRVDGVEWKIRHDYGVAAVDYKTAVTNAGS